MKKIIAFFMAFTLALTFTSCGKSATKSSDKSGENSAVSNSDNSGGSASNFGKALVVFYSATGSTKAVATDIADATGSDIFEIVPKDKYSSADLDWTDEGSRVNDEHNDESKRDIELEKTIPDNWSDYDTVFIGYPIWWGIAAWPINGFVKNNDFTGKKVIPFCTSASSGLGESAKLISEMAGTGNWLDGKRFSSGASSDEVQSWVSGLNV